MEKREFLCYTYFPPIHRNGLATDLKRRRSGPTTEAERRHSVGKTIYIDSYKISKSDRHVNY